MFTRSNQVYIANVCFRNTHVTTIKSKLVDKVKHFTFTKMVRAWIMDEDSMVDQRKPHRLSDEHDISLDYLRQLGVLYWKFKPSTFDRDPAFIEMKKSRGYTYQDIIEVSPEKLDNYEEKLKIFYEEHIHTDEEIRYVLEGSGYFDVRDTDDKWIRIEVKKGDMITLPAGIYHRFTLDENNYIRALRLFVGEPVWTAYGRDKIDENHPSRLKYKQMISCN
ncbi:1,2-dihydroxy-3-keto-5-methylthiopentene dioxygenase 1 [Fragariocoptes setiger]|uniref:Acireductone dioxygenase n=1 Tax=Fragariocoptes setiger TaxID=1670756 RepID=A0ABQ7SCZ9_9ACAR|nr:1,2-dihydroxy-3-keto-5-methylthiopentene dioxygenase 1 [Fragariocoptes setiger]